jgi:hypothetical protein
VAQAVERRQTHGHYPHQRLDQESLQSINVLVLWAEREEKGYESARIATIDFLFLIVRRHWPPLIDVGALKLLLWRASRKSTSVLNQKFAAFYHALAGAL